MNRTVILGLLGAVSMATQLDAAIMNGGFESGLGSWTTIGLVGTEGAGFGSGPIAGASSALLNTGTDSAAAASSDAAIEAFLGLASGSLDAISTGNATEGSAIKQTFMAGAGDTISFDFIFLTNEDTPDASYNDFAFVSIKIDGVLLSLIDTYSPVFTPSGSRFFEETGVFSYSHVLTTGGSVELGIGVMDVKDSRTDSGLLIDNVVGELVVGESTVPEPSSIITIAGLLGTCGVFGRWKKRKQAA